jgi:hypothetical protein
VAVGESVGKEEGEYVLAAVTTNDKNGRKGATTREEDDVRRLKPTFMGHGPLCSHACGACSR